MKKSFWKKLLSTLLFATLLLANFPLSTSATIVAPSFDIDTYTGGPLTPNEKAYLSMYYHSINTQGISEYLNSLPSEAEIQQALSGEILPFFFDYYDMISYKQTDSRWSSAKLCRLTGPNHTHTIGQAGCALTAYAMAINYLGYGAATPLTVVQGYPDNNACNFSPSRLLSNYSRISFQLAGTALKNKNDIQEVIDWIIYESGSFGPTIIGLVNNAGNTHFVAVYAVTHLGGGSYNGGSAIVKIRDTGNYGWTKLDQPLRNGWRILNATKLYD